MGDFLLYTADFSTKLHHYRRALAVSHWRDHRQAAKRLYVELTLTETPVSLKCPHVIVFANLRFPVVISRMNDPLSQQPAGSETALETARREKLRKIRELGVDPWGARFDGNQPVGEIRGHTIRRARAGDERETGRLATTARPSGQSA